MVDVRPFPEADEHDPERIEEIRDVFDDPSAVYIIEKYVCWTTTADL